MKIRDYAKSVGFEVVGKIRYIGLRKLSCRWYMDDAGNAYVIDTATGEIEIKPHCQHWQYAKIAHCFGAFESSDK